MKKILAIAMLFVSITALAQNEKLNKNNLEIRAYGSPLLKIGQINGKTGVFWGVQGGFVLNHRVVLGGKFNMLSNPFKQEGLNNINVGYIGGGAFIEYIVASHKKYHFSAETTVGPCMVYNDVANYSHEHDPISYTEDGGILFEPGCNLNVNLTDHLRIGLGLTYRLVENITYDAGAPAQSSETSNYSSISGSDLSGFSGQLTVKIGLF